MRSLNGGIRLTVRIVWCVKIVGIVKNARCESENVNVKFTFALVSSCFNINNYPLTGNR